MFVRVTAVQLAFLQALRWPSSPVPLPALPPNTTREPEVQQAAILWFRYQFYSVSIDFAPFTVHPIFFQYCQSYFRSRKRYTVVWVTLNCTVNRNLGPKGFDFQGHRNGFFGFRTLRVQGRRNRKRKLLRACANRGLGSIPERKWPPSGSGEATKLFIGRSRQNHHHGGKRQAEDKRQFKGN